MVASPDGSEVRLTVTNTGGRDGATVVQLYVSDAEASVVRPARELKGFAKVALKAGESRQVVLTLGPRAFAFYDMTAAAWRVEAGVFRLSAGFSAGDIRATTMVTREAETLPR
jgi:beta-glucosidase